MNSGLSLAFCSTMREVASHRERRIGLAVGDFEAQQRGAVLLQRRLHPTAGVEQHRGQRIGVAALGLGEGAVDDLDGLVERDRAHCSLLADWCRVQDLNPRPTVYKTAGVRMRKRPETEAEMAAILGRTHETGVCGQQNKPV